MRVDRPRIRRDEWRNSLRRAIVVASSLHEKLLDEVRQTLAMRYLDDNTLSIGEVGFLTRRAPAQYRGAACPASD